MGVDLSSAATSCGSEVALERRAEGTGGPGPGQKGFSRVGSARYLPHVVHTALLPFSGMAQSWAVSVEVGTAYRLAPGASLLHTHQ